jgi:hypothetical protein
LRTLDITDSGLISITDASLSRTGNKPSPEKKKSVDVRLKGGSIITNDVINGKVKEEINTRYTKVFKKHQKRGIKK